MEHLSFSNQPETSLCREISFLANVSFCSRSSSQFTRDDPTDTWGVPRLFFWTSNQMLFQKVVGGVQKTLRDVGSRD